MDIYDAHRQRTGRVHRRGEPLQKGEYGLVVCVWVSDGAGRLLLTKRAPEKESFPNAWENSGPGDSTCNSPFALPPPRELQKKACPYPSEICGPGRAMFQPDS